MFKPISLSKNLLFITCLTSLTVITACGNKDAQSSQSSPSPTVATVSKSSSTSAVATEQSSPEETTSEEVVETEQEAPQQEVTQATSFDSEALVAGDYSSIAGTWANAKGEYFTVTAEGIIYFGGRAEESGYSKIEHVDLNSNGRVSGSVGSYQGDERHGGAHISIVPAGIANVNDLVSDYDHIEIGHDISSGYSDQQYFRQ